MNILLYTHLMALRCSVDFQKYRGAVFLVNRNLDCRAFFVPEILGEKVMTKRTKKAELLNEFQAAEFLGLSLSWLRSSRLKKAAWPGPIFVRPDGWHVGYRLTDLIAFKKTRQSRQSGSVDPAAQFSPVGKAGAK